jgi:hypothetical protein
VEGLELDLTRRPGATPCEDPGPGLITDTHGAGPLTILGPHDRMRLYLIDLPDGLAGRVLAIAVVASEARFDAVVEAATPIIESIEFHPGT